MYLLWTDSLPFFVHPLTQTRCANCPYLLWTDSLPFFVHPLTQTRCANWLECGHFIEALQWWLGDKQNTINLVQLSSWECEIPSHYGPWPGRCEDKPSPACEHAVPGTRTELIIRTIAETNMALWAGQVNYDKSHGLVELVRQHVEMEHFRENCSVH